jgi:uncharacterized protein YndB with AHSA1/START domain
MKENLIARASITIHVPGSKVWHALLDPEAVKKYMFGTEVASDWYEGSPITWSGVWQGKPYQDKGMILQLKPGRMIQYSHFSPLSGLADEPENYHTVTISLSDEGTRTLVVLTQDNNATSEEVEHSSKNWEMMLASLKEYLETKPPSE